MYVVRPAVRVEWRLCDVHGEQRGNGRRICGGRRGTHECRARLFFAVHRQRALFILSCRDSLEPHDGTQSQPALRFCLVVFYFSSSSRPAPPRASTRHFERRERERERAVVPERSSSWRCGRGNTYMCTARRYFERCRGDRRRDWCLLSILCRYSYLYGKGGGCVRTTTILPPIHLSSFVRLFILPASLPPLLALWRSSLWMKEVHACRRKVAPATRTRVS